MDSKKIDYYTSIMELDYNFSKEELKSSYYRLIKKYHPDRFQDKAGEDYKEALNKFNEINEAYNFLSKHNFDIKEQNNKTEEDKEEKSLEHYYLNGLNLMKKGDMNSALECFLICHRKQPENPRYIRQIIRVLFTKKRRLMEALEYAIKLVEIEPIRNENFYLLGKCYYLLGRAEMSLINLEKAKAMNYNLEDINELIDNLKPKSFVKKMLSRLKK
ncbi:MAG: DnaJ domain-containing protein [Calditerrivibrio sp.]|nr:DnaJ domain-containing protein [Calditerrivibrio sp.]